MPTKKYLVELTPSEHSIVLRALRALQAKVQHGHDTHEGSHNHAQMSDKDCHTAPGLVELKDLEENIKSCGKLADAPSTVLLQRCYKSMYEADFPELRDMLRKEIERRLGVEANQNPFASRPVRPPTVCKALIHKEILASRKAAALKRETSIPPRKPK